jgi:hypothetical protein
MGPLERCALIWGTTIEATKCDDQFSCGVCNMNPNTKIMMKGICTQNTLNEFDLQYYVHGHKNEK